MNWRAFAFPVVVQCVLLVNAAAQTEDLDSASTLILHELQSSANNKKHTLNLYKDHLRTIRYDVNLFDEWIKFLLASGRSDMAIEVLKINPFLMSQHNELALYHYYVGVTQLLDPRGWPHFKEAEKSMHRAARELRRSLTPDYGFFSDVENAKGYLSIVARGLSSDDEKEFKCVVRPGFMHIAIDYFREALIYNPENTIAQRNLDTLLRKLKTAGLPVPPNKYAQNIIPGRTVSLDSVDVDSLNDVSSFPVLNYSLLPRNYQLILSELHAYDEIILLLDLSGSMDDPVGWSYEASKFHIAHALSIFIALNLRANVFLGALSIGQECDNTSMVLNYPIGDVSRRDLVMNIDVIHPDGHTPLNRRLRLTKDMFSAKPNKKLVFLLSDGMDTCGEIADLCGTAAMLAAHGIDLSIFSFIYESLDPESRSVYAIYNCMVNPSQGKIYKITEDGGVADEIDYTPVSNNILILPPMDTSVLWQNNPGLHQFDIENVEPPVEQILRLDR